MRSMKNHRIAIAGFQHETNTFAPGLTDFNAFQRADSWPELLSGQSLISATQNMNLPVAGAVAAAHRAGAVTLLPLLWCAAEPGGPVSDDAFEQISQRIIDGLMANAPIDALYLDLHGAMVSNRHADGEGELLARIRGVLGPDIPIAVSLDLHANISAQMVVNSTLISIYRSYPHLDMAATGERCMQLLLRALNGSRFISAFRQAPFLIPLHAQCTDRRPCRELYRHIAASGDGHSAYAELALGFTAADIADCGPALVAYAETQQKADALADSALALLCQYEADFDIALLTSREAVQLAMASQSSRPVVLADVQDNPGAGGTADTTELIQTLIDHSAKGVCAGVLCDSDVAQQAHRHGVGQTMHCQLGAKSGLAGHYPIVADFHIKALSDGQIPYTGEMYGGSIASIGPSALLSTTHNQSQIDIVVSSERTQCLDRALFSHFGIDPQRASILCVKSTVHFRADFETLSDTIINVRAPGVFECDLRYTDYRHLRPGIRISPMGPVWPTHAPVISRDRR